MLSRWYASVRIVHRHSARYIALYLVEEACLSILLAYTRVPVESACGAVGRLSLHSITWLIEAGRVASLTRRKRDGKVIRVTLLAVPGEIARRSPTSTVFIPDGLATTWCHRESHRAGL